jgi:TPR repeat protein
MIVAVTFLSGAGSAFAVNKALSSLVNHDYVTAYKEFKIVADQGDAPAQFNLGIMCKNGKGVPQDYTEAFKWFHMAADQGHVRAQYNVARMYYEGQGVKQDYVLAYMWADLAGVRGDAIAQKLQETIAALITPAQFAEAKKMALEWKPKTK